MITILTTTPGRRAVVRRRGKRLRRETEFDEWFVIPSQHIVIEFVDLGPIIQNGPIFGFHRTKHVVKDCVEAEVAKFKLVCYYL